MKPKKLKEDQRAIVRRARDKRTLFTFDMIHPFYYVKENIFKDSKKGMFMYFDEPDSKLVYIEESKTQKMSSNFIDKWIKKYHKDKEHAEKEREAKRESSRLEREKNRELNKSKVEESSKELKKSKTKTTRNTTNVEKKKTTSKPTRKTKGKTAK